ncbi:MAG: hypothetical protein IPO25_00260 [Saprospiraceae bacterium]|nr:hypothetical protein [Saprospiraceae bacterium]
MQRSGQPMDWVEPMSIQVIDGVLNRLRRQSGGQPGSPADDFVLGTGTGAIGDGVAATDVDHADPAQITIVDVAEKNHSRHFR